MPGLTLCLGAGANDSANTSAALRRMLHFAHWRQKQLYGSDDLFVAGTGYDNYSLEVIPCEDLFICVEGIVYNKNANDIIAVCRDAVEIARGNKARLPAFSSALASFDGEFIILCCSTIDGSFALFNDILGILPFYTETRRHGILGSRELKFFRYSQTALSADRLGAAQQLLFSCFLSERTYFTDVKRLLPGSMILRGSREEDVRVVRYHPWNLEEKPSFGKTDGDRAAAVSEIFVESFKRRIDHPKHKPIVLALSDGFDSRISLAALAKATGTAYTVTHTGWRGNALDDRCSGIAEKVAGYHSFPWECISLSPTDLESMRIAAEIFDGSLPAASPWHEVLPELERRHGNGTLFITGSGGNLVLAPLVPTSVREAHSFDQLLDVLLERFGNGLFDVAEVERLLGVKRYDIIDSVRTELAAMPESTLVSKYVHFGVTIRGFNWDFPRDDEYRYYFWHFSPFWSAPFTKAAAPLRSDYDVYDDLYVRVMKVLGACLEEPANNFYFCKPIIRKLKDSVKRSPFLASLYLRLRSIFSPQPAVFEPRVMSKINANDYKVLEEYEAFNVDYLRTLAAQGMTGAHFDRLLTVAAGLGRSGEQKAQYDPE